MHQVLLRVQKELCINFAEGFGDDCMDVKQIKECYMRFKNGRISVDNDPGSGRPPKATTSDNIQRERIAVEKDHRFAGREVESDLGIS